MRYVIAISDKEILEKFDCKIYLKTICIEMQLYNYNPIKMKCQTPPNHLKRTGNGRTQELLVFCERLTRGSRVLQLIMNDKEV